MNNKIKKIAFYGNEVTGPYEDVIKGQKISYGYVVYEDGRVEEIVDDFKLLNEKVAQARAENVVPLSYENGEKIRIHCEYDKQGVPLTYVDPSLGNAQNTTGAYTNGGNTVNPIGAGVAGAAAGAAIGAAGANAADYGNGRAVNPNANPNANPNNQQDEKSEEKKGSFGKKALCVGIAGAIGLGAGYLLWGRNKDKGNDPDVVIDNDITLTTEQTMAQYRLQEHFKITEEQQTTLNKLNAGLESMNARCTELGVPEAAFNTDEALVFSLMMSDVSNEEAARYIQPLGYTAEDLDTIYKSAVEKYIVIQSVVNSEEDVHMFDNFIIKTNGQSNRLSKEENEQKLQRALDAFHGSIKYNIYLNNAKEEDIDKENGTVKLSDGRVLRYSDIIKYNIDVIKAKETKDVDGNTVYGYASNSSQAALYLRTAAVSNTYHTTNGDKQTVAEYNVEGDEIFANFAKEYDELAEDTCDNFIDFEEVAYLANQSNEQVLRDVTLLTGKPDVRAYREANFGGSYDSQIEVLQEKYSNKLWNELDEEVRNRLWENITKVNNKLRYDATLDAGAATIKTERTVSTWTAPASDVISETKKGTGDKKEVAEEKLDDIYEEKKDEYEEKADKEGGKIEETDEGFTYSDTNEDGSGTYAEVTKDEDSVTSTEITADTPVITTPTDTGYVENPVTGEMDEFDASKAEQDYSNNEDYDPELNQQIVQEQQNQPTQQELEEEAQQINESYQEEGEDWEAYFEGLENGANVVVDEGEYEDVTDHGPITYIKGNTP